jgi:transaldolase
MTAIQEHSAVAQRVDDFVCQHRKAPLDSARAAPSSQATWRRLHELGTELWFDSGDIDGIHQLWTADITAVTTNNTLLNKEVQKGTYDTFIQQAAALLDEFSGLTQKQRLLELAFMLNARHGLALVERFGALVSVEEHTDLAHDLDGAIAYGRRLHGICPEHFIVKIPLTAAGILATRRLAEEGIPVNHTLGFSARQNALVTRLAGPAYVNVFLGRLNSVTADNALGSGEHVGERATLASQQEIRRLREAHGLPTRQIAASLRHGMQVVDLAGVDVMTMPIAVAEELTGGDAPVDAIKDCSSEDYTPGIAADSAWARFDTLWDVPDALTESLDVLADADLNDWSAKELTAALANAGYRDLLVDWTPEQQTASAKEGKIPKLENWRELLEAKRIGLDSLMNLAGLNSFAADQADMDKHVEAVLKGDSTHG